MRASRDTLDMSKYGQGFQGWLVVTIFVLWVIETDPPQNCLGE